MSISIVKANNK